MRRYLLDTGIASDYVNRRHGVYRLANEAVRRGHRVGITVPVLGELWAGVEGSQTRQQNRILLRHSLVELRIWPYSDVAAEEFGRIFADLKRCGRPMQQIDIQIAAVVCTLPDCTLVTKDSDFQAVTGIKIVDWSTNPSA